MQKTSILSKSMYILHKSHRFRGCVAHFVKMLVGSRQMTIHNPEEMCYFPCAQGNLSSRNCYQNI